MQKKAWWSILKTEQSLPQNNMIIEVLETVNSNRNGMITSFR